MRLEEVTIREFKKMIYPEYRKLFPPSELKPYYLIKKSVKRKVMVIQKIVDQDQMVGFVITNSLPGNPYLLLDYLGILQKEQKKGYGSKAIRLLQEQSQKYKGIFIEIEKNGFGKTEEENQLRKRRTDFYQRLGFLKLNYDIDLYHVRYETYVLPCQGKFDHFQDSVIEKIFQIYEVSIGKRKMKKYCKVIQEIK